MFFEWQEAPAARFAVIGNPISHSLSPRMQNAALRSLGVPGEYLAVRVPSEVLPALDHLRALGYQGVNVTVPNKTAVIPWLSSVEPFAARVGAVNTIDLVEKHGLNTDAAGFLDVLRFLDIPAVKDWLSVLVVGAGGSARSLIAGLALLSVNQSFEVSIWNRTQSKAEALVEELSLPVKVQQKLSLVGFDLIVNATSSTLAVDQALPIDWSEASDTCVAYDLSYPATKSEFLHGAAARGLKAVDGLGLLAAQGARSLSFWLGRDVPVSLMMEALG